MVKKSAPKNKKLIYIHKDVLPLLSQEKNASKLVNELLKAHYTNVPAGIDLPASHLNDEPSVFFEDFVVPAGSLGISDPIKGTGLTEYAPGGVIQSNSIATVIDEAALDLAIEKATATQAPPTVTKSETSEGLIDGRIETTEQQLVDGRIAGGDQTDGAVWN